MYFGASQDNIVVNTKSARGCIVATPTTNDGDPNDNAFRNKIKAL